MYFYLEMERFLPIFRDNLAKVIGIDGVDYRRECDTQKSSPTRDTTNPSVRSDSVLFFIILRF